MTPWIAARQASLSFTISRSLLKLLFVESVILSSISSSVALFSFCIQSLPESGSFLMSQLFISGGQSIGASVSILPMNIQGWFPLRFTGLISQISQARILEWVASSFFSWSSQPRDWSCIFCIGRQIFFFFLLLSHRGSPVHLWCPVSNKNLLLLSCMPRSQKKWPITGRKCSH